MTVNIIEVLSGAVAAAGSGTPTVTTSLVSTDRVVVTVSKQGNSGLPAVSGLGGAWTTDASASINWDQYVFSRTGITGGGTITISGFSIAGDYTVYVLRSSVAATPYKVDAQALFFSSAGAGTVRSSVGYAANTGAAVIAVAEAGGGGTITFPSASTPGSGWSTDYTNGTLLKAISQTLSAGATVTVSFTSNTSGSGGLVQAIYEDGTGLPPLSSTFVGWGNPIF